ncbi:hypothetical protein FOZ62_005473, partial [Perkinsus olseni]
NHLAHKKTARSAEKETSRHTPEHLPPKDILQTKLHHFSQAGAEIDLEEEQCELLNKVVTVTLGNGQKMISKGCFLESNRADHQLVYTVDTMEDSVNTTKALHVDCGGHIYTMDEDGQVFMEVGSHKWKLDFEDPFKEMNGNIFAQLTNCHEIFAELRRTLLQGSPDDSAGGKVGRGSKFVHIAIRKGVNGDFDDDNNYYIYEDPDIFPLVIMQTFIIWIPSVICLMIHIPQVYGATAFNSDNNEDPMEASKVQPIEPRRGPETSPARKRLQTNSSSLRKQQQGSNLEMPIESRSPSSDVCRVVEERVGGDDSSAVMCSLRDTKMNSLRYTNLKLTGSHRADLTVSVVCDDKTFWINDGHIQEIDIGGVDYSLYLTDPLLLFNRRASKMSCSSIFRALQTEVLERRSPVDEGDMTLCDEIMSKVCSMHQSFAKAFLSLLARSDVTTASENASTQEK